MNGLYIQAGASIGYILSRSPESLTLYNPSPLYSKVTYKLDTDNSQVKGLNVNPFIGLGYKLPGCGWGIDARYFIGTSKLAEQFPCKVSTIEVSLSIAFKLTK